VLDIPPKITNVSHWSVLQTRYWFTYCYVDVRKLALYNTSKTS